MTVRDIYDSISPMDYRYWQEGCAKYLSENGFTRAKVRVELALLETLAKFDLCPKEAFDAMFDVAHHVTTEDVYAKEKEIGHDIRALVECMKRLVPDSVKPFIHMTATSFDISDTANAWRYRRFVHDVLYPEALGLMRLLCTMAKSHANTLQIGRTHGQHAVPITFGFTLSGYLSRLGTTLMKVMEDVDQLEGKFSGAVGAYNASSLFVEDPVEFEKVLLDLLGLKPAQQSSQIVPPESLNRLLKSVMAMCGVLAQIADDMRHLSRTEIREVMEGFKEKQVGSSTMPQKRNPLNFENIKSVWKILVGRMVTVDMDVISDHQRDLTNSASARTIPEIFAYAFEMVRRMISTLKTLKVLDGHMREHLVLQRDFVLAEPLQLILSSLGYPDAHEAVRRLTLQAEAENVALHELAFKDPNLASYIKQMGDDQVELLHFPDKYVGKSSQKVLEVTEYWSQRLSL